MWEKNSHSSCLSCFPHPFLQPPAHHQLLKGWSQSRAFTLLNESRGTSCGESMLGLLWWIRGGCCRHCWWSECGILPKFSSPSLALVITDTPGCERALFFLRTQQSSASEVEGMMVDKGGSAKNETNILCVFVCIIICLSARLCVFSVTLLVFLIVCAFVSLTICHLVCLCVCCLTLCLPQRLTKCACLRENW